MIFHCKKNWNDQAKFIFYCFDRDVNKPAKYPECTAADHVTYFLKMESPQSFKDDFNKWLSDYAKTAEARPNPNEIY